MTDDAATNESTAASDAAPRRERSFLIGRALWGINLVLLTGFALWIFNDPLFPSAARRVAATVHLMRGGVVATFGEAPSTTWRLTVLWGANIAAITSLLLLGGTLFFGSTTHRRLRTWFAFTLLVAVWLTIFVAWRELAWQGQRLRLRATVDQFDAIAKSLRDDWPKADGERRGLGSFMAYPQGTPRMLMMLISETDPQISAIERADDGALGFEIRGEEPGTWLEWHPVGSKPTTFRGGLEYEYDFGRASPLGRGWYLVRYR